MLFDQAGLGPGKVGGRIGKSAAVRGLERGTSFGEVRAPYLQATPAGPLHLSERKQKNNFKKSWRTSRWPKLWYKTIPSHRLTVTWSYFDRRNTKMGVFLKSTETTPCRHLLKWKFTPRNPMRTPCSWPPWPWFFREKSLKIFKVS